MEALAVSGCTLGDAAAGLSAGSCFEQCWECIERKGQLAHERNVAAVTFLAHLCQAFQYKPWKGAGRQKKQGMDCRGQVQHLRDCCYEGW